MSEMNTYNHRVGKGNANVWHWPERYRKGGLVSSDRGENLSS